MGGLQAMEEHKWRYLRAAINRNGEDCLERYLREIKNLGKRARETNRGNRSRQQLFCGNDDTGCLLHH